VYNFIGNLTVDSVNVLPEMGGIHMLFQAGSALPVFVENEQ
jgi:hypothetical protein